MKPKTINQLQKIVADPEGAIKNDMFKMILNTTPPEKWVMSNPFVNNSKYLPIDKVELLLDIIFQEWKVELIDIKALFNGVVVSIKLHYKNPITGEWSFHDGVGACELQTKKDTGALKPDFSNINQNAIDIAVPIAKTRAVKDAADHIGRIFGRDISRKNIAEFNPRYFVEEVDVETLKKGVTYDNS